MQPAFESPANNDENSDDLSGDSSDALNHGRRVNDVSTSTSGGDGNGTADTGDLFSATLSAVSDIEMDDDAECEDMTIDLGTVVSELEREAARGGEATRKGRRGREERRQTAEKLTVDSLLDQIDSPTPVTAMSAGTATAAGRRTRAREENEVEQNRHPGGLLIFSVTGYAATSVCFQVLIRVLATASSMFRCLVLLAFFAERVGLGSRRHKFWLR